jgi:hypothetical protein
MGSTAGFVVGACPRWLRLGVASLALGCAGLAFGQAAPSPQIYSCLIGGKKLTSDRPIPECNAVDQRVLNPDGSLHKVMPPTPTADERAASEERDKEAQADRARMQEAARRDRNLLARFPNEAAHNKARAKALEDSRALVRQAESRLASLAVERKPLTDEAEFYVGKPLPTALKTQLDANGASADALRDTLQNQQLEIVRIDQLFDVERERLRKLWAGERPGSMGMLAGTAASAPPRK